ncbi:putative redox protein [Salinimicrobium catena]|uniref:Putative redox protein n=1 Tax=Salinimicrobium catena TaxID=390640 RepID=A0A1H5P067_9FLAO|nr:OsmC family protein [Salinimicrobium catena]SDL63160.1 putative redox protein [Salinimicrobium catena]SEF07299.1 putative redox protein [Salinimicrobium catena]
MKIQLKRLNDNYHFETVNERGNVIHLDNKSEPNPQGASPMELLLMGIAGCSGIDIVMILKKQQLEIKDLRMDVEGFRKDDGTVPNTFTRIHVKVYLEGDIPANKAQRAAALSFEKYCSVAMMLEKAAEITYDVTVNGKPVE